MITIFLVLLGIAVVGGAVLCGAGAFIGSDEGNSKKRATEAGLAAAAGALGGLGCILQTVLMAIPVAIALLIVLWVLSR